MTTYITDINQAATILAKNDIKLITFSHNISYDLDLSSIYFDEFVSNANGCHDVQLFENYLVIYGLDVSKNDKHFASDELSILSDDELMSLYDSLGLYYYDLDNKDDLIDELLDLDHEDYYTKYYSENCYRDLAYTFDFTGYSQGHYYKVQTVGSVESWLNDDYLTNIFYDTPISGNIEIFINGELTDEFYISEYLDSEYDYDKVQLINNISNATLDKEYHLLLNEYLVDNLKNTLEYSY